jgi:hypothetical protein
MDSGGSHPELEVEQDQIEVWRLELRVAIALAGREHELVVREPIRKERADPTVNSPASAA